MGQLTKRKILVTGAASGIGRAIAHRFLAEGAQLALFDRDAVGLSRMVAPAVNTFVIDLADRNAVATTVTQAAQRLGGLDGVVNAAGLHETAPLATMTLAIWDRMLAINLTAPMLICQAALPWLQATEQASIVNIGSASALQPVPDRCGYIASKAALVALSKALALELAPRIRVNSICPGSVNTPMLTTDSATLTQIGMNYALGRVGEPDEIANAALFLMSSAASFVTGTALAVDGGRSYH